MRERTGQRFEDFDRRVADALVSANDTASGLPRFLDARIVEFEPGRLRAEMAVRDELLTPFGTLHGGVMAGLVDHVLGCVLYPLIRQGQWAATSEFKLNYLAAVRGGMLVAESIVVSLTRSTAVVCVEVSNEGRLAGLAQGTVLIRTPKAIPDSGQAQRS